MFIAETTARGHVNSILRKLDVRNRAAAAAEGIRRQWVA
ncbi:product possible regulatory protein [Prochlorococcus sp. MIT 0702]|nr:product possible regulatory protein [Prochlorococcus sp. MIT 0702]KGG27718.1 product possible regulatory protein [Prochlorococcus sp. MIT 0701]KGG31957.1 product possible regulatory protein [Prochlorococcus sp. MIT 0703]